jgi:hypothetical protein
MHPLILNISRYLELSNDTKVMQKPHAGMQSCHSRSCEERAHKTHVGFTQHLPKAGSEPKGVSLGRVIRGHMH